MALKLTQLRDIVEKVASAPRLNDALEILVNEICHTMETEVCSLYLADHERGCYYLMATRGLKKPRGQNITLALDEGIVGLVGRLAEPINLADAPSHPSFKYIPSVNEEHYRAFLAAPIVSRRTVLGVLVVQQRETRQYDESEESFLVTLATQVATLLSPSQLRQLFGLYRQSRLQGIAASPGVAIAPGWVDQVQPLLEQVTRASALDIEQEQERLLLAMAEAGEEFRRYSKRFSGSAQKESAEIFNLYSHLLSEPRLKKSLLAEIEQGIVAEWAVKVVIEKFAAQFLELKDNYLRDRANDLRELGQRLLFHLDDSLQGSNSWPERFVLVADELTATSLAEIPQDRLAGIVVRDGAANSHAAILTRAMGIPTVMGVDIRPEQLNKRQLIVDAYRGEILIEPEPILIKEYQRLLKEEHALSKTAETAAELAGELKSGEHIAIMLNAGLSAELELAQDKWVEGIGLYRTEVPFMLQSGFPSEEEQVAQYQGMLQLFHQKPVTLRTLDIGADKQLPYMPISEENPALGWRGIRLTLDQPEIFLVQIRAMLRANVASGNLRILLPMITSIEEIDDARHLIDRATHEVEELLGYEIPKPQVGIMLEVPSMIFLIPQLALKVDFISVGTNDLTQYLLAVDRNNTRVANLYSALHPAVLHALYRIMTLAKRVDLPVCLCGEMAGDPTCVPLLVGMGYRHLSMNGKNIPRVKYLLRHLECTDTEQLAAQVLQSSTTSEVRYQISVFMERRGLGGLIRGGR